MNQQLQSRSAGGPSHSSHPMRLSPSVDSSDASAGPYLYSQPNPISPVDALIDRVRHLCEIEDVTPEEAAAAVAAHVFSEDEDGSILLDVATPLLVHHAHFHPVPPRAPAFRKPAGVSWMEELRNASGVMDLQLTIPGIEELRRVGDLNAADIVRITAHYSGESHRMSAISERWRRIRRKMEAEDTLETAWQSGRLMNDDVQVIGQELFA